MEEVSVGRSREQRAQAQAPAPGGAPGAPEGARSATGGAPGRDHGDIGRFSARRKSEAVLRLLRGEDLDKLSRELGVTAAALGAATAASADGEKAEKRDRAFLGISLVKAGAEGGRGIVIGDVVKDTAAEKAGLKKGDIILKLGEKVVEGPRKLVEMLAKLSPGDEVALLVERDGWQKTIKAKLGKRPAGDDDDDDDGPNGKGHPEKGDHDEGHKEAR